MLSQSRGESGPSMREIQELQPLDMKGNNQLKSKLNEPMYAHTSSEPTKPNRALPVVRKELVVNETWHDVNIALERLVRRCNKL